MYKKLFLIAPAFLMMACGETTTEETTSTKVEPQEKVEEIIEEEIIPELNYTPDLHADAEIKAYLKKNKWQGVAHESGMYVVTDNPGDTTERPNLSHQVTIFYQGYLLDGTKFDGTATDPATFGLTQLITGWQIGIPMFGKGGKGKLIIPSGLAYGDQDNGDIPGGSTLMFEIELVDWSKAPKQQMQW